MTLAASLCAGAPPPGVAQEEGRPAARDVPPRKVIRTQRLRVPADLFKQDPVSFKRARVDASGTIRADGHNLDLYGAVLIRRDRICASPEGAPLDVWPARLYGHARARGGPAPQLRSFRQAAGAPKPFAGSETTM